MAPRANWKGFLRLSLVTCPVALYPATSDTEKVSFNQINRKTGHRIKYAKVDAETGEEVASEDIMKGYKIDTDTYIEVSKDELDDIALESTRTIEIDEFVPKSDIDGRYLIRPYYLVPDGKVGHDAFAVIRETIRSMDKVAIGRVVLTNREHIIALEPLENGLMGTLLRYPYEVRNEKEYFDDIQDVKITKDMLDLARHIVEQKSASFEPEQFEDRYEQALPHVRSPLGAFRSEALLLAAVLLGALRRAARNRCRSIRSCSRAWVRGLTRATRPGRLPSSDARVGPCASNLSGPEGGVQPGRVKWRCVSDPIASRSSTTIGIRRSGGTPCPPSAASSRSSGRMPKMTRDPTRAPSAGRAAIVSSDRRKRCAAKRTRPSVGWTRPWRAAGSW
jgi:Ku protein